MIISHKHKFIFFAVPKTGTHAVRFALRPFLGEEDEEQVGLYVNKSLSYPSLNALSHGHITARQAQAVLPSEIWNSYYKFAFVRNPFDRFISFGFYMNRQNRSFKTNTTEKLKALLEETQMRDKILFHPQHEFLCDDSGKILLDFVGRHENFASDFATICNRLKIDTPPLEHFNATRHQHFSEYYDEELLKSVRGIYEKDLSVFDYGMV